ncbi:MAG TPA: hypothetical protein VEK08_19150 [Planctomycetota bacterium]|nr:hypothetical protein [Planctomycetota bacterium]
MAQRIEAILADPVACEWDEDGEAVLMPAVEVLTILARRLGFSASGVTSETVQRWKQKYLKVFDATFHTANGSEEFNAERRKVIVDTFEELEKLLL